MPESTKNGRRIVGGSKLQPKRDINGYERIQVLTQVSSWPFHYLDFYWWLAQNAYFSNLTAGFRPLHDYLPSTNKYLDRHPQVLSDLRGELHESLAVLLTDCLLSLHSSAAARKTGAAAG